MSKMGQYILDQPYVELDEPNLEDDPGFIAWAENQDNEDIEFQDSEES